MEEIKIEEGMYVRTKKGIARVKRLCGLDNVAWTDKKDIFFGIIRPTGKIDFILYDDGTVIGEPSFNILDVIKKGDLVTIKSKYCEGETYVVECEGSKAIGLSCLQDGTMFVDAGDIKEVLTKEQFETMAYSME